MTPAVQQAIEARVEKLDAEIQSATQTLTSHVDHLNTVKAAMDTWTHNLHVLELEREELVKALPVSVRRKKSAPETTEES